MELHRLLMVVVGGTALCFSGCSSTQDAGSENAVEEPVSGVDAEVAETAESSAPAPVEPEPPKEGLQLVVSGFADGGTIPDSMAFCVPAAEGHTSLGPNNSPELKWSQVPEGTKSFAIICHDSEAPTVGEDVNKEGKTVSPDLARADFFHWVLADMTPGLRGLSAGQDSSEVTTGGKSPGPTDYGARGINDYTVWFAGDEKMRGEYGGYDGPCPPWNDERVHVYHFTVYALSVESLNMGGSFSGPQVLAAMEGKILDQASWTGTYTLNKALRSGASPAPAAEPAEQPAAKPAASGTAG